MTPLTSVPRRLTRRLHSRRALHRHSSVPSAYRSTSTKAKRPVRPQRVQWMVVGRPMRSGYSVTAAQKHCACQARHWSRRCCGTARRLARPRRHSTAAFPYPDRRLRGALRSGTDAVDDPSALRLSEGRAESPMEHSRSACHHRGGGASCRYGPPPGRFVTWLSRLSPRHLMSASGTRRPPAFLGPGAVGHGAALEGWAGRDRHVADHGPVARAELAVPVPGEGVTEGSARLRASL